MQFSLDLNSILFLGSIFLQFGMILLAYRLFGKMGLFASIGLAFFMMNLITVKICEFGMFGGYAFALGGVAFGSTFLITDILNENHGVKEARWAIWMGLFFAASAMLLGYVTTLFVPASWDWAHEHLGALFGFMPRIVAASYVAYLVSGLLDVKVYRWLRDKSWGKIWVANNGSTFVSKLIDACIFNALAFAGWLPFDVWVIFIPLSFVTDMVISTCDTPFVYWAKKLKDTGRDGMAFFKESLLFDAKAQKEKIG